MSIDIEEIRKHLSRYSQGDQIDAQVYVYNMGILLDEVERYREALEGVKARDDYFITRAEKAEADRDHLLRVSADKDRAIETEFAARINLAADRNRLGAAVDAVKALANNPIPQT